MLILPLVYNVRACLFVPQIQATHKMESKDYLRVFYIFFQKMILYQKSNPWEKAADCPYCFSHYYLVGDWVYLSFTFYF